MIRTFRNDDVPAIAQWWRSSHEAFGSTAEVAAGQIERAIFARPSFRPHEMFVADSEGVVDGFLHVVHMDGRPTVVAMHANWESGAADRLLSHVMNRFGDRTVAGLAIDQSVGYAGLSPLGWGIGVDQARSNYTAWLHDHGWTSAGSFIRMGLRVGNFRLPMSRQLLQWRREAAWRETPYIAEDYVAAAATSHLNGHDIVATANQTGDPPRLRLWSSDIEAGILDPAVGLLDPIHHHVAEETFAQFLLTSFLDSGSVPSLREIKTTVCDDGNATFTDWLRRSGFEMQARGDVYHKA